MIHHSQLRSIDRLIRKVITGSMTCQQFKSIHLNRNIILDPKYQYSEAIQIYDEVMQLIRNKKNSDLEKLYQYIDDQGKRVRDQDQYYQRCEMKNQEKLLHYLQKLMRHYARLLFIRVDFAIKKEYQHEVDIQQFQTYLQVMSNRYSNQDGCFANLQGYAWALEEGEEKGLHCHTLLIYDGNKHQNDFGLGLKVAQYWSELTEEKGCCFISNDPEYKKKFETKGVLGIGMIHRDNEQEVTNALNTARYLVNPEKELQHLRVRLPRMRTFATGQYVVNKRRGIQS